MNATAQHFEALSKLTAGISIVRSFRAVAVATIFAVLQACAVSPATRLADAPEKLTLDDGKGVVIFNVTSNRELASPIYSKFDTLQVTNVDTKKTFSLFDRADPHALNSLFVDTLPAGHYKFEGVGVFDVITETAGARNLFPEFQVKASTVTDLGTVAIIRAHYPVNSAAFWWGQTQEPRYEQHQILQQLSEAMRAKIRHNHVLGWDEGAALSERDATFKALRHRTIRLISPTEGPDDSMFFGESFGQVAIREKTGQWHWLQTGATMTARCLFLSKDRKLFAGFDEGLLLVGDLEGAHWHSIETPLGDSSILYVGLLPETNDLVVIGQSRTEVRAISTPLDNPGIWTEEFRVQRQLFQRGIQDAHAAVLSSKTSLSVVIASVESAAKIVTYQHTTHDWVTHQLSDEYESNCWFSLPDGEIGIFKGIPLTGIYFSVSKDGGETWGKRGNLNWAICDSAVFATEKVGYVIRLDHIPAIDPEAQKDSLWRTDDGGNTWTNLGTLPGLAGRIFVLGDNASIGYFSLDGRFFSSGDGGKSWKIERRMP